MNTFSNRKNGPQVVVAHLGARLHYGVAEVLYNQGLLKKLFTDFYFDRGSAGYQLLNRIIRQIPLKLPGKALQRTSSIDGEMVTSFPLFGLQYWLELSIKPGNTSVFLKYNRRFGTKVTASLKDLSFNSLYGFSGSSLEIFQKARELNATTYLEQMGAPVSTSRETIKAELDKWPGWQSNTGTLWNIDEWHSRELKEWKLADHIIVPSPYIEEQLSGYNIDRAKISRIPYAVSLNQFPPKQRTFNGDRKLNTLYVGELRLLKGIPYLLEAANEVGFDRVNLACVGYNHLTNSALAPFRDKVRFTGALPGKDVQKWYEWADVLVMPSLCEGSSAVTYEAKVSGLPLVATFNSGAWIEDAVDGMVIPERSSTAISNALEQFLSSPELINRMSGAAIDRRHHFGWEKYQHHLYQLITSGQIRYR